MKDTPQLAYRFTYRFPAFLEAAVTEKRATQSPELEPSPRGRVASSLQPEAAMELEVAATRRDRRVYGMSGDSPLAGGVVGMRTEGLRRNGAVEHKASTVGGLLCDAATNQAYALSNGHAWPVRYSILDSVDGEGRTVGQLYHPRPYAKNLA